MRLLTVPGTPLRRAKTPDDIDERRQPLDVVSHAR